jgi:2-succinyl-6-hydroxy-2,4-cyclohexadiene-1-carboxylate synthase
MGSAEDWVPVAGKLSVPVVMVDLPGHGGSVELSDALYSFSGASEALCEVMDFLQFGPCLLVGYSMGGRLALYFALHHPERCRALLLESASPGLRTPAARAERRWLDDERARRVEADFAVFLEAWYRQPLFDSLGEQEGRVEEMVAARLQNAPRELARVLRSMGTGHQPSLWGRLGELKIPTLALAGALDTKYVEIARRMAEQCATMRVAVVPDAGHNIHAEHPERYLEHLIPFIQTVK